MRNEILNKTFTAASVVSPYRLVKFAASLNQIEQAASAADQCFGVANLIGADAIGDRVDVVVMGIAEVEFGGVVTAGNPLTADAEGKAVVAVAGDVVAGCAMASGVAGDIGSVLLGAGGVQG